MTTNTNAAQVANNLIAVAEDQAFEAWYKQDCLVGGVNARIAARAAWNARAALTTAAAVPPEGFVMVPVELANRVQESLGEFLMDHGWSQRDMDTSDEFGAVLLAADPKAEPVPAGEYPPLPTGSAWCGDDDVRDFGAGPGESALMFEPTQTQHVPLFTAGQMRAYVDADRAMRAQAAPAAVAGSVAAWMTPEGDRVVTEATMAGARKDGGAMLSSMRPYTVALVRAAAPATQPAPGEQNESAYQRGYMDGMAKGRRDVEAAPQQEAQHLAQALTDRENQPNQYGVEFGMSGTHMHFKIGNQLFKLAYEPDEQEEFDFMKRMLVNAFSIFTHDVKTTHQPQPVVREPLTDGLLQQHNRDSQELRRLCAARDQARSERDALKAEIAGLESSCSTLGRLVDELRPDAERLEWVLRRVSGTWLRAYLGVVSDTSDMDTLRTLIDANRGALTAHGVGIKKENGNA